MKSRIIAALRIRLLRASALVFIGHGVAATAATPQIESWFVPFSGRYARLYPNDAARTSGIATSTWSNGSQTQMLPAYSGVQEIYSSSNWIYIRSTGLGSHVMGPWPAGFPNLPLNTKVFYRLPRSPAVPSSKTLTGLGSIGYFVDGVAMFDSRDGFVWTGTTESGMGTGYWNREAYVNEGATFDPAYAHQEQSGTYHYHANPIALRYLLGDHVVFNSSTKIYSESTEGVTNHSPILGWVRDGFPVYGPYGFSNPTNPASGIRRMTSGFQLRNGQRGTDNLTVAGRATIPAWASRLYNVSPLQSGPNVSAAYPLGRYMEDNAFLGDLGFIHGIDFDLDSYNGRFCVTPEFPGGTYAYFVSIASNGVPLFPYNIGRAFYGTPAGGAVTALTEPVSTNFVGGPSASLKLNSPEKSGNEVVLVWTGVEGGTYRVEETQQLTNWIVFATNVSSQQLTGRVTNSSPAAVHFYRVARTALASYDSVTNGTTTGGGSGILSIVPGTGARGGSVTATVTLSANASPPVPPQNAPINSIMIGSIPGTAVSRPSQYSIQATFAIPAGASPGAQTVSVVFPGPPDNPTQTVTYTLPNGFTVN